MRTVERVQAVQTVEAVQRVETVQNVETVQKVETVETVCAASVEIEQARGDLRPPVEKGTI